MKEDSEFCDFRIDNHIRSRTSVDGRQIYSIAGIIYALIEMNVSTKTNVFRIVTIEEQIDLVRSIQILN